jgi:WD40 repeat protein
VASGCELKLFDCEQEKEKLTVRLDNELQSLSWNPENGQTVLTSSKDGILRLWDPRASVDKAQQQSEAPTGKQKSSRTLQLTGGQTFVTTLMHPSQNEYSLFDCRQFGKSLHKDHLGGGNAPYIPQYDQDTNCIWLVARGSTTVKWLEISPGGVLDGQPAVLGGHSAIVGCTLS